MRVFNVGTIFVYLLLFLATDGTCLVMEIFEESDGKKGSRDVLKSNASYTSCLDECKARDSCTGVSYHNGTKLCLVHEADAVTPQNDDDSKGFVYSEKQNWKEKTFLCRSPRCDRTRADCSADGDICKYQDCQLPTKSNGNLLLHGNLRTVGSKIAYECKRNHTLVGAMTLSCLSSKEWSQSYPSCVTDITTLPQTTAASTASTTTTPISTSTITVASSTGTTSTATNTSSSTMTTTKTTTSSTKVPSTTTTTSVTDTPTTATTSSVIETSTTTTLSVTETPTSPTSSSTTETPITITTSNTTEKPTTTPTSSTTETPTTTLTSSTTEAPVTTTKPSVTETPGTTPTSSTTETLVTTTTPSTTETPTTTPISSTIVTQTTTSKSSTTETLTTTPTSSTTEAQVTTTTQSTANYSCPDGWIKHDSSCYFIIDWYSKKNFDDAMTFCKNMNATLAVPNTQGENDYIKRILDGNNITNMTRPPCLQNV